MLGSGEAVQPDPDPLLWGTPWRDGQRLAIAELAEVVLAEHRKTGARAHVKVLRLDVVGDMETTHARERLGDRVRLEADILRGLAGANVPRLVDVGFTPDGRPYFATEPVEGAKPLTVAAVSLNGTPLGQSPLEAEAFADPGKQRLVVQKPGYADETRDLSVGAGLSETVPSRCAPSRPPAQTSSSGPPSSSASPAPPASALA